MKLYRLSVKDSEPDNFRGFIVAGNAIPEVLESVYRFICLDDEGHVERDIPFVLRSSNMDIQCLGEFIPDKKFDTMANRILMTDFYNA